MPKKNYEELEFQILEGTLEEGVIQTNKPRQWSSFDVIRAFRHQTGVKKVGHAGTLDPLATGSLILCTGKKTKEISRLQEMPKTYELLGCLGATTDSLDAEFDPEEVQDCSNIDRKSIEEVIESKFLGEIKQTPPVYSAVKIKGKRAYELVRKGQDVKIQPKTIEIHEFVVSKMNYLSELSFWRFHEHCKQSPDPLAEVIPTHVSDGLEKKLIILRAQVKCSKGTYIRSLALDVAKSLGTQGYLIGLKRLYFGQNTSLTKG
jgi:tRNA pseudouridine55 synthase